MRVPTIFWWPEKIKPGVIMDMATTMDLLPTFCKMANASLPDDRIYDGYDISPVIFDTGTNPRDVVFFYREEELYAIRKGEYKAHFITKSEYGENNKTYHDPPLLYDLNIDPSEKYNIAAEHADIITAINKIKNEHLSTLLPVENQLEK
jgi:arylsulfatase A-like enzyme